MELVFHPSPTETSRHVSLGNLEVASYQFPVRDCCICHLSLRYRYRDAYAARQSILKRKFLFRKNILFLEITRGDYENSGGAS
jgi:hypothetical protein